jgi:hypothetical protein
VPAIFHAIGFERDGGGSILAEWDNRHAISGALTARTDLNAHLAVDSTVCRVTGLEAGSGACGAFLKRGFALLRG